MGTARKHPGFNIKHSSDLKLLPLESDAPSEAQVATRVSTDAEDQAIQTLTLLGWGINRGQSGQLNELTMPRVAPDSCAKKYRGTIYSFSPTENLCSATTKDRHACKDDSGGPVLALSQGVTKLAGVMSVGCFLDKPDRHMRIVAYNAWIDCVMSRTDADWPTCPQ